MNSYGTLVEALNDLSKRGYTTDFNLIETKEKYLDPNEFEIAEVYRFEGMNDPSDSVILYAIKSRHGLKGTLVNAYGAYSDSKNEKMVSKLDAHLH